MKKKPLKDVLLKVRITAEEKAKFEKAAEARHTDLSELTRQLLHKEAEQVAV
jgi:uncharacterized protein (DUF1778 family)